MAVSVLRSLFLLAIMSILSTTTEAGLAAAAAPYLTTAPLAIPVAAAYTVPSPGVLRTAYSQVVGRSYAPSFVPVASSLAYAAPAPVVKALPTVYAAPPQLVAGPVLKTVRPYAVEAPLTYATPAIAPVAPVEAAPAVPAPVFTPSVLSTRLAPLPAVGVAPAPFNPTLAATPAASLPGVIDARSASNPASSETPATVQRAFVTAFGSLEGIRLVGVGSAFEGASTNVEVARAAPSGGQNDGAQQGRSANPAVPAAPVAPESFGVQQQTPFNEYGPPVVASASVNP